MKMGILVQQDLLEIGDFSMKNCRVMRIPEKTPMNYGALKNFDDHMKVTISYMEFKQIIRKNRGRRDYFSVCLPSRYIF